MRLKTLITSGGAAAMGAGLIATHAAARRLIPGMAGTRGEFALQAAF